MIPSKRGISRLAWHTVIAQHQRPQNLPPTQEEVSDASSAEPGPPFRMHASNSDCSNELNQNFKWKFYLLQIIFQVLRAEFLVWGIALPEILNEKVFHQGWAERHLLSSQHWEAVQEEKPELKASLCYTERPYLKQMRKKPLITSQQRRACSGTGTPFP